MTPDSEIEYMEKIIALLEAILAKLDTLMEK